MSSAGIAHVLSVSGLHLTIVAGGVFAALRLALGLGGPSRRACSVKRIAAAGGIAAAGSISDLWRQCRGVPLDADDPPRFRRRAVRAAGADDAERRDCGADRHCLDPASVFRPSFQLSFAAVVALVGAYENFRERAARDAELVARTPGPTSRASWFRSLVAGGATLLFSVYHFQQTSPLGVVGNLLEPAAGRLRDDAGGAAGGAGHAVRARGAFPLAMGWSIDRMLDMAAVVAGWSTHLSASPLLTPLALVIGLWRCLVRVLPRPWRLLGPVAAVPLVVLFALDRPPDVLIADTTQAMVMRGPTGSNWRTASRRASRSTSGAEPMPSRSRLPRSSGCDSIACIGTARAGSPMRSCSIPAGFRRNAARPDRRRGSRRPSYCGAPGRGRCRRPCSTRRALAALGRRSRTVRDSAGRRATSTGRGGSGPNRFSGRPGTSTSMAKTLPASRLPLQFLRPSCSRERVVM